ncbi:hypothetical protein [Polluticoccus soli]|uniref:hypothetical protein n=1 Tax=Polluticoccus soli TaxID=3034150 RepID=UPI0023E1F73A|nr:hypothetical protein [Flavipsychrobacter sp. JY13-12]
MRAIEWIEQAERTESSGKCRFVRQKLIDALEAMSDEQINTLCSDITHLRGEPAGNSDGAASSPEK